MKPTPHDIYRLYRDGFAQMQVGRTLWVVIIIKLIVIFAVLKLFFFPDYLGRKAAGGDKAAYVSGQLTRRAATAKPAEAGKPGAATPRADATTPRADATTPHTATKQKPENQR